MPESATQADDEASQETKQAETEPVESSSDSGNGLEDYVSAEEQEIIKEWLVFVTGLFGVAGLAVGLDAIIQDTWNHALFDVSGSGGLGGLSALGPASLYASLVGFAIIGAALFGFVVARNVDNEEKTAFKVAAATAFAAMPVFYLVTGILILVPVDNVSLEFVNAIVSGIGSGVAAAIGAAIVVWLTENQAPDGLRP